MCVCVCNHMMWIFEMHHVQPVARCIDLPWLFSGDAAADDEDKTIIITVYVHFAEQTIRAR